MNTSKVYEQSLQNIFVQEDLKKQKEKFVKRLINTESRVKEEAIEDGKRVTQSRLQHNAVKTYNKKFMQQEKDSAISKNNALLIKNLLEISNGKRAAATSQHKGKISNNVNKSLNFGTRKKEMERIAKENFDMVKRLHRGTSVISKREQDSDFKNHSQLKKNIMRTTAYSQVRNQ